MNLLDPTHITPEVLRRAFSFYRDSIHPAHAPHVWEEDDHDVGLDGRFNLSLLGRYIEEAYCLDCVAKLKPGAPADEIEAIIRMFGSREHTGFETDRFVVAMKCALGLKRHEVDRLMREVGQKVCQEQTRVLAQEIAARRAAEKAALRPAKVVSEG